MVKHKAFPAHAVKSIDPTTKCVVLTYGATQMVEGALAVGRVLDTLKLYGHPNKPCMDQLKHEVSHHQTREHNWGYVKTILSANGLILGRNEISRLVGGDVVSLKNFVIALHAKFLPRSQRDLEDAMERRQRLIKQQESASRRLMYQTHTGNAASAHLSNQHKASHYGGAGGPGGSTVSGERLAVGGDPHKAEMLDREKAYGSVDVERDEGVLCAFLVQAKARFNDNDVLCRHSSPAFVCDRWSLTTNDVWVSLLLSA